MSTSGSCKAIRACIAHPWAVAAADAADTGSALDIPIPAGNLMVAGEASPDAVVDSCRALPRWSTSAVLVLLKLYGACRWFVGLRESLASLQAP